MTSSTAPEQLAPQVRPATWDEVEKIMSAFCKPEIRDVLISQFAALSAGPFYVNKDSIPEGPRVRIFSSTKAGAAADAPSLGLMLGPVLNSLSLYEMSITRLDHVRVEWGKARTEPCCKVQLFLTNMPRKATELSVTANFNALNECGRLAFELMTAIGLSCQLAPTSTEN